MQIIIPFILIASGLVSIFYLRPKAKNSVTEIQYMQTKTIEELKAMFEQMDANGLGNEYREFVELKGTIVANELAQTPFSNRKVAYCKSKLSQVTEIKEQYRDSNGNYRTRINKQETEISSEKSSQDILLKDGSVAEPVTVEINANGCQLKIPRTFDRFEPKNNLNQYPYFRTFSRNQFGAETLGFRMTEETIEENQHLYVIGEAFKVGNTLHIGKPMDNKKPFIVTTKSEEDLINSTNQKAFVMLIGGVVAIVMGIALFAGQWF